MRPRDLLRDLERRTHDDRMKRMVQVGRQASSDGSVAATLDAFERCAFYERYLALQSCFGSADGARALRALDDPSRTVRGLALVLVPLLCDDAQVRIALDRLPAVARLRLLRRLRKRRRIAPIDAYVHDRVAAGDEDLGPLLPFASEAVARRYADEGLERARWADWHGLARAHPAMVAALLIGRIQQSAEIDPRLSACVDVVLPALAEADPERGVELAQALAGRVALSRLPLQPLADRRPAAVADLLLASPDPANVRLDRAAHRLGVPRLEALLARRDGSLTDIQRWFPRLSPADRQALYERFGLGWRDRDGALAPWLVGALPLAARQAEARRIAALPALAARAAPRLRYATFLPWDEAQAALEPAIRDVDAEIRGAALASLIGAARYERVRAADVLAIVQARRNEQDPVRLLMLTALSDLPPSVWRTDHLDGLSSVLRAALDAADLSSATSGAAYSLVIRLLPFHPQWAATWLATVARERGETGFATSLARLSESGVQPIVPLLTPVLRVWETREREGQLVAVARGLGRRLHLFPGLAEAVERVARETRNPWIADWALEVLRAERRQQFAALVPALLREDRSCVTRPAVHAYLHRRRQDLLTPFLGQRAYRGRFSTGKTRYVLPLTSGFFRWTPAQQVAFGRTLRDVIGDRDRHTGAIQFAVCQLAALPAVPPDALTALAADDREAVRDTALMALGGLDAGQGLPVLVDALGDDRARVAVYALRSALLEMAPDRALALLLSAPRERVTVAKEVVRLLGALGTDAAYAELLALDVPDLHRDVRAALLRALWDHVERDETWPILERAATSGDPSLASVISRLPVERLSDRAGSRLVALIDTLLRHPEPRIRVQVLDRCGSLTLAETRRALLPRLLVAIGSPIPDERTSAAAAAMSLATADDADLIAEAIGRLLDDRRALTAALGALQSVAIWRRTEMLPVLRAVLDALARDPLTAGARARLAVQSLPWEDLGPWLEALAADGLLHADALAEAQAALRGLRYRPDADGFTVLERVLAAADDDRLRRLGLTTLVAIADAGQGWDAERLARLQEYRADRSPLVAEAAQFTFPSEEIDATGVTR